MEALVSVIIPVYNVSPYLREALDSVIHQTYKNLEILIIDDGSTDDSGAICDEYLSDSRVIVIHQENRGLSGARNTGLNHVTGEYIAFLDPDDAYHPDMIMQLLRTLIECKADLVECSAVNVKTEKCLIRSEEIYSEKQEIHLFSTRDAFISLLEGVLSPSVWNKLYCCRLWEQLRFPEGYVYEDMRIMPLLLEQCDRIVMFSQILVYHRQRNRSITYTNTKKNLQDNMLAFQLILTYANTIQPPLPPELITKYREKRLRYLIFKHANLCHSKAFLNSPDLEGVLLEEIQDLSGNDPEFFQAKTKVVWWLYRHCPVVLLPAQACFRFAKSLWEKCRRGHL